jgi:succinate dehydrogenase / fumarate reductase cytochrome b subunit
MTMDKRPLSPHLQIYRWQLTMVLSILHRATGIALWVGTVPIVYWLVALASGPEAYDHAKLVLGSMLGQLAMFLWTWALFYHLGNGIRHLVWDAGYGLDLESVYKSGRAVVAASLALTFVTWLIAA